MTIQQIRDWRKVPAKRGQRVRVDGRPGVITGRKVREWGFWCPRGFVPWHQFVDHSNTGNVGKGCGE